MRKKKLRPKIVSVDENAKWIGGNLSIVFNKNEKNLVSLIQGEETIKKVDLLDKASKKLFVIEAVELGATKYKLAEALNISRQTIHNYIESKKMFGIGGLIGRFKQDNGKQLAEDKNRPQNNRIKGNKAVILAEARKAKRLENKSKQLKIDFEFGPKKMAEEEMPFFDIHDWKETRFAGIFPYFILLTNKSQWIKLLMNHYGTAYKIFFVFLLMAARNIKSIEQLKNVNNKEAGLILGFKKLPMIKGVWKWFYSACVLDRSKPLRQTFFMNQIQCGLVNTFIWFTDGYLLPYSGNETHHNEPKESNIPGQTNMVTCDITGRIVDFAIQDGTGDLENYLIELKRKWEEELGEIPFMVFDGEGYSKEFFNNLIENQIPFVAWDKYHRRMCGLSWDAGKDSSTVQCAEAILSRCEISENTFKHMNASYPYLYHPGFESQINTHQSITNPEIKDIEREIKMLHRQKETKHKENFKAREQLNKDGTIRENSKKARLESEIIALEERCKQLFEKKKDLPEKIDVSSLEDYRSFEKIDNEGKNIFDFVTTSVWNSRKELTDWLLCHYPNKNECVALFHAITACKGWVKSESERVIVRLEPLRHASHRHTQEQLCKKLNTLNAQLPSGKLLQIEVGKSPTN
jgi:hypothetical protein